MHIEFCFMIELWSVLYREKKNRIDMTRFFFASQGINEELRLLLFSFLFSITHFFYFFFFFTSIKNFQKTTIIVYIPFNHSLLFLPSLSLILLKKVYDFTCQRFVYIHWLSWLFLCCLNFLAIFSLQTLHTIVNIVHN